MIDAYFYAIFIEVKIDCIVDKTIYYYLYDEWCLKKIGYS